MKPLFGIALLVLLTCQLSARQSKTGTECHLVSLTATLKERETYQRRIDGLTFKIKPMNEVGWGWIFTLEDERERDFIYFVNPPLRFNSAQTLGRGYGDSAGESLKRDRELRFLLNRADYDAMEPIVTNALWSYNAPRPEKTADEYFGALAKTRTGLLRLKILNSDVAPDDTVRSAEFLAEFVAPSDFVFDSSHKPRHVACPAKPKP